jgi:hypothetical protein
MAWFEIYYRDGSVYKSEENHGRPYPYGVQVIAQPDEDHEVYFETGQNGGGDFYYWFEDRWWGTGWEGIYQYLFEDLEVLRPTTGVYHKILIGDEWVEVNDVGLIKYMVEVHGVLLGRMVSNARYQEIFQMAKRNKQTFHPRERKPE